MPSKIYKKIVILIILSLFFAQKNHIFAQSIPDEDGDGLTNEQELTIYHTNPKNWDTDEDGFSDKAEIDSKYSPTAKNKALRQVDTDKDGLWDDWELILGTDLANPDSDGDGHKDGVEVTARHDPKTNVTDKRLKEIKIDLAGQTLSYWFDGHKLDEFKISSGLKSMPTPAGNFTVIQKKPVVHYKGPGYDFPNTKWNLMFKRGNGSNYYVHGAYWHNDFGKVKSHGCVNVPYKYEYMGRLYDWAEAGTLVIIK